MKLATERDEKLFKQLNNFIYCNSQIMENHKQTYWLVKIFFFLYDLQQTRPEVISSEKPKELVTLLHRNRRQTLRICSNNSIVNVFFALFASTVFKKSKEKRRFVVFVFANEM